MVKHLVNRVISKQIGLINIAAYHFHRTMAGLLHNESFFNSMESRIGSKPMAQAVGSVELRIEPYGCHIFFNNEIDTFITEPTGRNLTIL